MKRLIVVGNGGVGITDNGKHYVNGHTGEFLKDLLSFGVKVTYCELAAPHRPSDTLAEFCIDEVGIVTLPFHKGDIVSFCRSAVRLLRAIIQADFVYVFFPGSFPMLVVGILRILGTPFGLYIRGERFPTGVLWRQTYSRARLISLVSPTFARHFSAINKRVKVIRPMLAQREETQGGDTKVGRSNPVVLLYVGRLEPSKGIFDLLAAAELLKKQTEFSFQLRLVGSGCNDPEIVRRVSALGDNVLLLGPIHDWGALSREYGSADLFVFLSHHEGFPRVLYEAMLHSLPIVTTFVGGIEGRMVDGENCVRVPVGDPVFVAEAIYKTLASPEVMERLGMAALATYSKVMESHQRHSEIVFHELSR